MTNLTARMPRPRIGVLPTGHEIYWSQFPGLQERCRTMWQAFRERLEKIGEVIAPEIVDTPEKAAQAGSSSAERRSIYCSSFRLVIPPAWWWRRRCRN